MFDTEECVQHLGATVTLVLAWLNRRDHPTGIHIAADSLLTDTTPDGKVLNRWMYATKVFRFQPTNEHFAYSGTSLRALCAITGAMQLISNTDNLRNCGNPKSPTLVARATAIAENLTRAAKYFPTSWGEKATLIHAGFDPRDTAEPFKLFSMETSPQGFVLNPKHDLSQAPIWAFGSGEARVRERVAKLNAQTMDWRYENIMALLIECIRDASTVGGVPQGVVIHRRGYTPIGFNVELEGTRTSTLFGIPIRFRSDMTSVHFKDRLLMRGRNLMSGRIRRV